MSFDTLKTNELKKIAESFGVDSPEKATKQTIILALQEEGITYDMYAKHAGGTSTSLGTMSTAPGAIQYNATLKSTLTGSNSIPRRVDATSWSTGHTAAVNNMTASPVTQEIGTGFGDATTWQTTTTNFTRANPTTPDSILAVYYNTARNLEKMGIQLKKRKDVSRVANAFPAYDPGCKPPPGWQK